MTPSFTFNVGSDPESARQAEQLNSGPAFSNQRNNITPSPVDRHPAHIANEVLARPYAHQEFPKMLHPKKPGKKHVKVHTPEEEKACLESGDYSLAPVALPEPPSAEGLVSQIDELAARIEELSKTVSAVIRALPATVQAKIDG